MKKILCICLSILLLTNNAYCAFADDFGGSSGSIDAPALKLPESQTVTLWNWMMKALYRPYDVLNDIYGKFNAYIPNESDGEEARKYLAENATQDENNYYINVNFFKTVNQKVQSNVHALDGYYLIEPQYSYNKKVLEDKIYEYTNCFDPANYSSFSNLYNKYDTMFLYPESRYTGGYVYGFDYFHGKYYYYCDASGDVCCIDPSTPSSVYNTVYVYTPVGCTRVYPLYYDLDVFLKKGIFFSNSPFKIFYSKTDLNNYLNKGRTYAPMFPEINLTIPKYYIDNSSTTTLPNIDLSGINIEGKTEVEIQAQIDLAMKNYFDKLLELSTKPTATPIPTSTPIPTATPSPTPTKKPATGTDPTPTPRPGITDIPTTPTPGGGNVDLSDTNNLLQKIYDWLVDFGKSHDTLAKTITDYIERNDGKLDDIITAIDNLSKGETTPEENGCKYDFTALSDFLTSTWNESDKKFDTMIELLEENNRYQQQLVNLLDDIKKELIKENVIDLFKNRSSETANKAKEKFPTSLPWDIAVVVNSMSAEPQEISLTIPVKIKSLGIDEELHIDITGSEWEKLAKTCRYLLSLLFILYLVHLSRKLFFKGDDD